MSTVDDDDDFNAMLDGDLDDETDGGDEDESYGQSFRTCAPAGIRRALEERSEARAMNASLDYLDLDFDDED